MRLLEGDRSQCRRTPAALEMKNLIAAAHPDGKPYIREAKEKRRKVPREESGTWSPATVQLQGANPGHEGTFGPKPAEDFVFRIAER